MTGRNQQPKASQPPRHLRDETRKWWQSVVSDYELEPHHLKLLTLAAEAWDRATAARAVIEKKGLTYEDRFGQPKARPEVAIERDSRIGFARLLRELGLDETEPDVPRPPRSRGRN